MTKRYGGPTPGESVAALFRGYGITVDPERLEDRAAALKSRQKVEDKEHLEWVRGLARTVKKARRNCELREYEWRERPNADTLAAAMSAQQARNAAQADLREACLQDEELISAVTLWARNS